MKNQLIGILLITIILTACSTVPTKAKLGSEQTLTNEGFIQSKREGFVVRISKLDTTSNSYKSIAKYGLPIRIIVANMSDKPITFGPTNITVYKNNQPVQPLTAARLDQIKDRQKTKNTAWSVLNGALAMAVGVVGATSGDTSLAQSTQQYTTDSLNYTAQSHMASQQNTDDRMSALSTQLNTSLLQEVVLQPRKTIDGVVFFENVKAGDSIVIKVRTDEIEHMVSYQK
ncbi:hypothetical protein [Acinetobacter nematophilus]|uniref:Lipoprotein n=1 Tax=Acinetobacter nematophilus TaxID=2994642 RepID=A0A9X3DW74_9GAMM|nr:hypothetical protein [Acinetobacter nematophilus]MCX5466184.1 hypothetical protein [Acinetobacter nematophilus]